MSIWDKTVRENISLYAPWVAILRRFLASLRNPAYLIQWWDQMAEPVLDHLAQDRSLAKEAWANTLAAFAHDGDGQVGQEEGASQIATRMLKIWMQNSQFAGEEGSSSGLLKAKLVHGGLLIYGKKRPKVCSKPQMAAGVKVFANQYLQSIFAEVEQPWTRCSQKWGTGGGGPNIVHLDAFRWARLLDTVNGKPSYCSQSPDCTSLRLLCLE